MVSTSWTWLSPKVSKLEEDNPKQQLPVSRPPPPVPRTETFQEKTWRKFSAQPLIPIGCLATAYALVSGIRSFQKRDPVRSQKMMRYRILGQAFTLVVFLGYIGMENGDFRLAPMYQDRALGDEEKENDSSTAQSQRRR